MAGIKKMFTIDEKIFERFRRLTIEKGLRISKNLEFILIAWIEEQDAEKQVIRDKGLQEKRKRVKLRRRTAEEKERAREQLAEAKEARIKAERKLVRRTEEQKARDRLQFANDKDGDEVLE